MRRGRQPPPWNHFFTVQFDRTAKYALQAILIPSFKTFFKNHVSSRPTGCKVGFAFFEPSFIRSFQTSFVWWLFWPLIWYISKLHVQHKGFESWPTNPFAPTCQATNCNCCTWEFISRAWQSIIFRPEFDSCFSSLLLKEVKIARATIEIRNLVGWPDCYLVSNPICCQLRMSHIRGQNS